MKELFAKKTPSDPELDALKAALEAAREDLFLAYQESDHAVDPELVEACVYQISAVKARCNYLIRRIKACSGPQTAMEQEGERVWT